MQETRSDSGQPKVGRCQHFSRELKKGHVKDREVQVRATAAEKDTLVDRHSESRRRNTSICVYCDASPLYPPREKKNGHGGWWMAPLTGGEQRRVIPKGLKRENDYFLAKWFWLELQLNLVWDRTSYPILKHRSYTVTELLQSYRLYPDLNFLIWLCWVIPALIII